MTLYNGMHIYVSDFIVYRDAVLGETLSKVQRIFTQESMCINKLLIIFIAYVTLLIYVVYLFVSL